MYIPYSTSVEAKVEPHSELWLSTNGVDGPSTPLVETRARQQGPCWRVMETGHPSTRAVNSGRQLE